MKHSRIVFTYFAITLVSATFLFQACKKDSPTKPPDTPKKPTITLAVDDTTCMEAWIKLTIKNGTYPMYLRLTQDGNRARQFTLYQQDTLLYYDSLLPQRNYTYFAALQSDTAVHQSLTVRTMDTTSHNFTWQVYEFGQGPGDIFYDVAILDENHIWAVGYVSDPDSANQGNPYYNLYQWDGTTWKKNKAKYGNDNSMGTIDAIFSFSANDVFLGILTHWNGNSFYAIPLNIDFPTTLNGMWGKNWQDITVVGREGMMAHYNGSGWTRIPSLTNLFLSDIFGNANNNNMYVVGGDPATITGTVLGFENQTWKELIKGSPIAQVQPSELFITKLYGDFTSCWVDQKGKVYVAGGFAYQFNRGKWNYLSKIPLVFSNNQPYRNGWSYLYSIRGAYSNDVMIAGELNTLQHFNGYNWQQVGPPFNSRDYDWRKIEIKGNTAVAVGFHGSRALVMILKR